MHTAWSANSADDLYYKKLNNDGVNLTGDILITGAVGNSQSPSVVIDSSDNVHIVWEDRRDNSEIYYKKLNNDGVNLTGDIRTTNNPYNSLIPSMAIDSSDNIHGVWLDNRDGNYEIYYKHYGLVYPKNITLDVDADGSPDWTYTGTLTGMTTTSDLSSILNSFGSTPAVLNFTSDTPGIIRISNINFLYSSSQGSTSATIMNTGLEDTTLKKIWATSDTGDMCVFTPAYTNFSVGDFLTVSNAICPITCNNFVSFRATTTCGTSDEFTGVPEGC